MSLLVQDTLEPWIAPSDVARERRALDPNGTHGDDETYLEQSIVACSSIELLCGSADYPRQFLLDSHVDVLIDGKGGFRQRLPGGPIVSISEFIVNSRSLTIGTAREFALRQKEITLDGSLVKSCVELAQGNGNIVTSYVSGYERGSFPPPLRKLAAYLAALFYNDRGLQGMASKADQGATDSYTRELPGWWKLILAKYQPDVAR